MPYVKSRNPMRWIGIRTFVLFYHDALIAFIYDDRPFRLVIDDVSTGFFSATASRAEHGPRPVSVKFSCAVVMEHVRDVGRTPGPAEQPHSDRTRSPPGAGPGDPAATLLSYRPCLTRSPLSVPSTSTWAPTERWASRR